MHAFLQWKLCPHCDGKHFGIIRSGPEARVWPDPWDAECTVDNTGTLAVIEAYWGSSKFTRERQDVIVALVNQETGKKAYFERRGAAPRAATQVSGVNSKGRVIMATQSLHSQHGSKLGAQTDQKKVIALVELYLVEMKAGRMTVDHITEIDVSNGKFVRSFLMDESKGKG